MEDGSSNREARVEPRQQRIITTLEVQGEMVYYMATNSAMQGGTSTINLDQKSEFLPFSHHNCTWQRSRPVCV
jgi:hypothetical protein